MKILHLFNDEKVINRMIRFFEDTLPSCNYYMCFCHKNGENYTARHIDPNLPISFFDPQKDIYTQRHTGCDKILIHFLDDDKARFVDTYFSQKHIKVCWIVWGGDLYNTLTRCGENKLFADNNNYYKNNKFQINALTYLGYYRYKNRHIRSFIENRISYILGERNDLNVLKKLFPKKLDFQYQHYFYYPIEDILGDLFDRESVNGGSILCGNSSSYFNNHEYVLEFLRRMNVNDYKLVFPMSYGGCDTYRNTVIENGYKYFSDKFTPLLDFLPIQEYNNLFINSNICVYGNWKPEALGNILIALYLGSKVYMSNHSPLYEYLTEEIGLKLFLMEEESAENFRVPINENDKRKNRQIIIERYSTINLIRNIKSIGAI